MHPRHILPGWCHLHSTRHEILQTGRTDHARDLARGGAVVLTLPPTAGPGIVVGEAALAAAVAPDAVGAGAVEKP